MTHFKKHNQSGTIFIEIMFALVLLSIFGTSLFMIQSLVFSKTFNAHSKVLSLQQINSLAVEFHLEQAKQKAGKEATPEIMSQQKVKAPLENITIQVKDIPEDSVLHKSFAEYIKIIQQTATFDDKQETYISFEFMPPVHEEKKETP